MVGSDELRPKRRLEKRQDACSRHAILDGGSIQRISLRVFDPCEFRGRCHVSHCALTQQFPVGVAQPEGLVAAYPPTCRAGHAWMLLVPCTM